ncbi:4-coumarate--CoA ligase 1-like [Bradysia coprophila]|uniref:4-coumarate--CoA ligase 1-like n=1 Tax=Bradysia coprophila TaxID=38358 RepID=UPI00187D778C|nr:4-coumarate--CoA ligase 1-like [Bradysia coprophila]
MTTFDAVNKVWKAPKAAYPRPLDNYFGEELLRTLSESPDAILEISHDESYSMSRKEARELTINVARNLMKLNVQPNDVIGVICRNSKYLPVLIYGCIVVGAPINPLDNSFDSQHIKHIFGQTKPSLIFCDAEVYHTTKLILEDLANDAKIFTLREKLNDVAFIDELLQPTDDDIEFVAPKFDEPADQKLLAIICTSGSTGFPKGTKKTHANFMNFSKAITIPTPHRTLNFTPIYWTTGFIATIFAPLRLTECKVSTIKLFSPELLKEMVEKYRVQTVFLSSHHLSVFMESPLAATIDFSSVRMLYSGGGIIGGQLRRKLRKTFPKTLFMSAYAMTEISVSLLSPGKIYKHEASSGNLQPNVEVKIIDDDGSKLGVRERGEILVKSLFPFSGYYANSDESLNAVDSEGFFKTGDIGFFDDDTSLVVVDRKKELFHYKSYHVNPSDIEDVILSMEGVADVAVVGISDPRAQYLATAAVVKKSGFDEAITERTIVDFVANRLPFYKHLYGGVVFMDSLPVSPAGKVMKRWIREQLMKKGS